MKKLLLFFAAGIVLAPAFAQQNNDVLIFKDNLDHHNKLGERDYSNFVSKKKASATANKTTANSPFWYSYVDALYQSGVSKGYYNVVYQDSNLTYQGTTGLNNVFQYGMGILFDPMDSAFYYSSSAGQIQDYDWINQTWIVNSGDSYVIDSMQFNVKYYRTQNVTDSLIIYIAKVAASGNPTGYYTGQFSGPPVRKFISAWYDSSNNEFSSQIAPTSYVRIAKALDAAAFEDTTLTGGYLNMTALGMPLPAPMTFTAGQKALVYVHFKSGQAYPLGTPVTSANYIRMYSYDIPGQDLMLIQNKNSYMTSMYATRQIKYTSPNWNDFTDNAGHSMLIPGVGYTSGNMTDFAFRVTCANCFPLSVKDASNLIGSINAYPNPANTEITIPFTLKEATATNVTISNTVGQVMGSQSFGKVTSGKAVFSTANLASGVYFYTVEANGARSTGRFVVSH